MIVNTVDVIVIGAGAAGLMCTIEAGKRGRSVLVLERSNKPGKKILMSGGGRCNFTNYYIEPERYLSHNPHFCKSALSRYTPWDFIELVKKHKIPFHEKTLGQLFCDNKAKDILNMLLCECEQYGVEIKLNANVENLTKIGNEQFQLRTNQGKFTCKSLVIASGGLSIPTLGSSPFGYRVAEQFGLKVWPTRAGLVPFTLHDHDKERFATLSGVAVDSLVQVDKQSFRENLLFTHRGLSGPAILQISSYWQPGDTVTINLLPDIDAQDFLLTAKQKSNKQLKTLLHSLLPKRLLDVILPEALANKAMHACSEQDIKTITALLQSHAIKPNATEGYRTAEVTLGGVDVDALSSKTMQVKNIPGLYFIGEVVDVTGWLGGYNFQWAWSSGWAAGHVV